jgi:hypothetical protein
LNTKNKKELLNKKKHPVLASPLMSSTSYYCGQILSSTGIPVRTASAGIGGMPGMHAEAAPPAVKSHQDDLSELEESVAEFTIWLSESCWFLKIAPKHQSRYGSSSSKQQMEDYR